MARGGDGYYRRQCREDRRDHEGRLCCSDIHRAGSLLSGSDGLAISEFANLSAIFRVASASSTEPPVSHRLRPAI
jgi:hypothetical protein